MRVPLWYQLLLTILLPIYQLKVIVRWLKQSRLHQQQLKKSGQSLSSLNAKPIPLRQEFTQRFRANKPYGFTQSPIWLHAVSVGETNAAAPLIKHLLQDHEQILLTHTTHTGMQRSQQLFADVIATGQMQTAFVPVDTLNNINAFLNVVRPKWVGFVETELWPNILWQTKQRNIPTILLNGRLSEKSKNRYAYAPKLIRSMLHNISVLAVQNMQTADRFKTLGALDDKVHIVGNIKFDQVVPLPTTTTRLLEQHPELAKRSILLAASTHEGEEAELINQFKVLHNTFPELLLVIAPRHPERFATVQQLIERADLPYIKHSAIHNITNTVTHHNDQKTITPHIAVFLLDTLGALWAWYQQADVCFVGGSLVPVGGHNIIEPALCNTAIAVGRHTYNFEEVVSQFKANNALKIVDSGADLMAFWQLLLELPQVKQQMADAAQQVVQKNTGAITAHLSLIKELKPIKPLFYKKYIAPKSHYTDTLK